MSSPWAAPDSRPAVAVAPVFQEAPAAPPDPPLQRELVAGVLTALGLLLCAPAVGVVWAAVAPRVDLAVDGDRVFPRSTEPSAFIAGDGLLLLIGVVAGVLTGLVAWRLGRRYGLGVVLGLVVGGLAAGYLASVVGEAVAGSVGGAGGELSGRSGAGGEPVAVGEVPSPLAFRLRAPEVLVGWPVGALAGFLAASVASARSARRS